MTIIGPNFGNKPIPLAKLTDIQPRAPHTRAPSGRTPWRVVTGDNSMAVIKDRDGSTLIPAVTVGIAHQIVTAVNAYVALNSECAFLIDVLRALRVRLHTDGAEEAVAGAKAMIEAALSPESDR